MDRFEDQNQLDHTSKSGRHPKAQSPGGPSGYRRSYDLCSLGIFFIEIILWKPIEEVLDWNLNSIDQTKLRQVRDTLCTKKYSQRVAVAAGNSFAQVVDYCLRADAVDMGTNEESTADLDMEILMSHKIEGPLRRMELALSAT